MFDPGSVTVALGVASSAMSQIKKFYDHGKDLSSMSAEIGKWMSASSEIDEIEKGAKNPTLFRKLLSGKGVEGLAFEAFQAKKKLSEDRYSLEQMIKLRYGSHAWAELIEMEGKIRRRMRDEKYARLQFREKVIQYVVLFITLAIGVFILLWVVYGLVLLDRGEIG